MGLNALPPLVFSSASQDGSRDQCTSQFLLKMPALQASLLRKYNSWSCDQLSVNTKKFC